MLGRRSLAGPTAHGVDTADPAGIAGCDAAQSALNVPEVAAALRVNNETNESARSLKNCLLHLQP
jgi:hypothetical protein